MHKENSQFPKINEYGLKVLKVVIAKTKIGESVSVQMICFLHNYKYMQVSLNFLPAFPALVLTSR